LTRFASTCICVRSSEIRAQTAKKSIREVQAWSPIFECQIAGYDRPPSGERFEVAEIGADSRA
jgi:hypothetical protein